METILEQGLAIFGQSSTEDFKNTYRLRMRLHSFTAYDNSVRNYLYIKFVDPFHNTYTKESEIYVETDSKGKLKEYVVKKLTSAVRRKVAQIKVLEEIKAAGLAKIKKFIAKSFTIDSKWIEDSDIEFKDYCGYVVAGHRFQYEGTLSDKSIYLYKTTQRKYDEITKIVDDIREYFKDKEQHIN